MKLELTRPELGRFALAAGLSLFSVSTACKTGLEADSTFHGVSCSHKHLCSIIILFALYIDSNSSLSASHVYLIF